MPATPAGIMEILDAYEVELQGASAVVIGRSNIVGKPISLLLLQRHATVTICHSRTRDLAAVSREADVLVAAVGKAGVVTRDMVKPGADRDRRRDQPGRRAAGRRRGAERRGSGRPDDARAGRRRPDDDRGAAAQHGPGRAASQAGSGVPS